MTASLDLKICLGEIPYLKCFNSCEWAPTYIMVTHCSLFSPWLDRKEILHNGDKKEMATGHQSKRSIVSVSSCPERKRLTENHHKLTFLILCLKCVLISLLIRIVLFLNAIYLLKCTWSILAMVPLQHNQIYLSRSIGVWWWIFGSRSTSKVTPEVFSWD